MLYSYGGNSGILWITLAMMIIPLYASLKVQNTFNVYSRKRTLSGYTGEEAARRILAMNNINISIQPVRGSMTDFYDPVNKTLALSESVYSMDSIAALGVAAHEAGHAIQDANDYAFLRFRHTIYPVANFASRISMPLVFIGLFFGSMPFLVDIGIWLFAITTVFAIVTLPVEFNASKRALATLESSGILAPEELVGAKKVLDAAALTYVAAAMASILSLIRLIMISNRNND
ncbi:zinc metallopeptidase [Cellulosilyticum lentocellum]|uniref:Peptidase membrane zinc metallopeptidase n=1 Tax=Cellulosilyticum lentocellum (strain ATCC 49066 / DSM 5427 / NCIMB 11756 / RHM5) TaxID=642492 RepID=F2JMI0_CELLD|nr:zinc metallopeptidase [Cellulosilyticum lentocellum]ADZ83498.1 peptidase membrane zinc metallopeptidase [Cellulosilyticum lentocellum DSM 5427]